MSVKKLLIEISIETEKDYRNSFEHKISSNFRKDINHTIVEQFSMETKVFNKSSEYTITLFEAIDSFIKKGILEYEGTGMRE